MSVGGLYESCPSRAPGFVIIRVRYREAFIRNKRATGRAKDLGDIENL